MNPAQLGKKPGRSGMGFNHGEESGTAQQETASSKIVPAHRRSRHGQRKWAVHDPAPSGQEIPLTLPDCNSICFI